MAAIAITGGGAAGLTAAMVLAGDGHEVTLCERDGAEVPSPEQAWARWERRGVNQFRLLHFFQSRFRVELERELPHVAEALAAAGLQRVHPLALAPESLTGGRRPDDDRHEALTGRRPVVEAVLAATAQATPGVTVRRGVAVQGLLTGSAARSGVPHVTGVRLESGEEIRADLVVDATGRRSPLPAWLEAAGARPPVEEVDDMGFVYYGRHFRSPEGSTPPIMGPLLQGYGSLSVLTLPADNGTWGVGLVASAGDTAMRALKDVDTWSTVVKGLPLAAHWLDGEPLGDRVDVMAKIEDRHRSFSVDGTPVATGVVAVADAWACTNPSVGRGATLALLHVLALRDTLGEVDLDDPVSFHAAWEDVTATELEPWFRDTLTGDRHRLAEVDGEIRGEPYRPDDWGWDAMQSLRVAAGQDGDCLRALLDIASVMRTADEVLADPGLMKRVSALGSGWREAPPLGPDRAELLSIVSS